MKKSVLAIFLLFLIVLPLAGCGSDSDSEGSSGITYNLSLDLKKAKDTDDFRLSDCARIISGDGKYNEGSRASIKIEYISNGCIFNHLEINNVIIDENNIKSETIASSSNLSRKTITYQVEMNENKNVSVYFVLDTTSVDNGGGVIFDNISKTYYPSGSRNPTTVEITNYSFPYLDKSGSEKVERSNNIHSPSSGKGKLNEILISGKKLNLNYIYLEGEFKPYKLTWDQGTYTNGICDYDNATQITDPNNFEVTNSKKICVSANLNLIGAIDSTLKTNAINKIKTGELYINTGSGTCSTYNQECSYVWQIENLYSGNDKTTYRGVSSSGINESVTTKTDGSKYYKFCKDSQNKDCYVIDYNTDYYTQLSIKDFIDEVLKKDVDDNNLTFDYNYSYYNDIVITSIKVGDTTYSIEYKNATNPNSPSDKIQSPSEGTKYTSISYEGDNSDLSSLVTSVNSTFKNLVFRKDTSDIEADVQSLIYSLIDEDNKNLKSYYYKVTIENGVLKIEAESAKMDIGTPNFIEEDKKTICYYIQNGDNDCLSENAKNILKYIGEFSKDDFGTLDILNIKKEENTYTYTFKEPNVANEYKLVYDKTNNTFTLDSSEIKLLTGENETLDISKISRKDDVIFTIIQELTPPVSEGGEPTVSIILRNLDAENSENDIKFDSNEITLKTSDGEKKITINVDSIKAIYTLLTGENKVYAIGDKKYVVESKTENSKTTYTVYELELLDDGKSLVIEYKDNIKYTIELNKTTAE